MSFIRTILLYTTAFFATIILGFAVMIAALLRVKDVPGGIYDNVPAWWSTAALFVVGVKVRVHGRENLGGGGPFIFASNHVSWFDVPSLSSTLPRHRFIAKAELFKVPVFGPAMRAAGMVEIQRDNRKAAFGAYDVAAERIRGGQSVVVFPEGTRGTAYPLRPFKKGPFVLAIAAGVPIVPIIVHGSLEVMPKGTLWARSGAIDIHLLEPVTTTGVDYDHRDTLMKTVRGKMANAMRDLYGVEALTDAPSRFSSSIETLSSETAPTETR